MPHQTCLDLENSYYHVYNRGVNKQNIFLDSFDRFYFIKLCRLSIEKFELTIHGFCLMNNHYHLLIHTKQANLSKVMKYIGESYAKYYTQKYKDLKKSGHVFMGRYGRKVIDTDEYLKTVLTYIHLNPVKDSFCKHPGEYQWSSYNSYLKQKDLFNFTNINQVKQYFQPYLDNDHPIIYNHIMNTKDLEFRTKKIINSEIMKEHLREYKLDESTFKKLYTYCLLEWTELDSKDLEAELKMTSANIRKIKSNLRFELEENNHLLQNLIYSVRKSLQLF